MKRNRLILSLWLAGASLAAAACTTPVDPAAEADAELRPVTQEAVLGAWRLQRIGGRTVPAGGAFTLSFAADGRMTGTLNCNSLSAPYRVEVGRVLFGEGDVTAVGCRGFPDLSRAERAVFGSTRAWVSADGRRLVFEGEERAMFGREGSG